MSCQHLQKHLCCLRMQADKTQSHCWSISPRGTAPIFPASDFRDWSKNGLFFPHLHLPERVSLHTLWKLDFTEGCHILRCEWRKPTNGKAHAWNNKRWSEFMCFHPTWTKINKSIKLFFLAAPFVWKPSWNSSFAETLRRARTCVCPLLVASLRPLLPPLSEADLDAR